jgi:hypothetical protein
LFEELPVNMIVVSRAYASFAGLFGNKVAYVMLDFVDIKVAE